MGDILDLDDDIGAVPIYSLRDARRMKGRKESKKRGRHKKDKDAVKQNRMSLPMMWKVSDVDMYKETLSVNNAWAENAKVLSDIFWHCTCYSRLVHIINFPTDKHLKLIKDSKLLLPLGHWLLFSLWDTDCYFIYTTIKK